MDFKAEFDQRFNPILEAERERREDAFLDAPIIIAGIPIAPFTLWHWSLLDAIRSPLLIATSFHDTRGIELLRKVLPSFLNELAHSLWVLSREFSLLHSESDVLPAPGRSVQWYQQGFIRRIRDTLTDPADIERAANEMVDHVRDAFADVPATTDSGNGGSTAAHHAYLVHNIARSYHWAEHHIRRELPLTRLWQYLRVIEQNNNPESSVPNPSQAAHGEIYFELLEKGRAIERSQVDALTIRLPDVPLLLN